MASLEFYSDSVGRGKCRSCGASVTWVELTSGRKLPLEGWDHVATRTQGSLLDGERTTETVDTSITPTHWERCPDAETWRRRNGRG